MKIWLICALVFAGLLIVWNLWFTIFLGVKEPPYTIMSKKDDYEIRRYGSYITASVVLSGSYSSVANVGFRILAKYIFGDNTAHVSMPMTVPVLQESQGVKMSMTAPVFMSSQGTNAYRVSFVMPGEYTLETLPGPRDSRIMIEITHSKTVAAYAFTWYPSERRVEGKKKKFEQLLAHDGVHTSGSMVLARYTPPFILPFLMRNELLVDLAQ
jgi:hypothetical protein